MDVILADHSAVTCVQTPVTAVKRICLEVVWVLGLQIISCVLAKEVMFEWRLFERGVASVWELREHEKL